MQSHCIVALCSPDCLSGRTQQRKRVSGSKNRYRQKMRSGSAGSLQCLLYVHELIVCCTGGKRNQIKQSTSKSGGEIGMIRRQKMRSECRVLLVYCVITTVFSPCCMCCTGFRGYQRKLSSIERGGKIGMKRRQKMRSECRVLLVHCIVPAVFSPGCM